MNKLCNQLIELCSKFDYKCFYITLPNKRKFILCYHKLSDEIEAQLRNKNKRVTQKATGKLPKWIKILPRTKMETQQLVYSFCPWCKNNRTTFKMFTCMHCLPAYSLYSRHLSLPIFLRFVFSLFEIMNRLQGR